MTADAGLSAIFGKPAQEVVDYLARKRLFASDGWETVSALEQQRGFTVAQTAGFNVLGDIYDALKHARDEGWTHKDFQKQLEPILRAKGWWGKAIDPETGEITKMYPGTTRPVMYGSPARLRLIYDTNMASAYGAGRFERQRASAAAFPYLRYVAVMDSRTRAAHRALNGQVWPVDHPFWQVNYPPNGYRCRCMAQSLSRRDVQNAGVPVNEGGELITRMARVNANGDMMQQRGWRTEGGREFWADPGFDTAPGNSQEYLDRLGSAFERLPETAWVAAAGALSAGNAFALWRKNPEGNFPIAQLRQRDANLIGQVGTRLVSLSPDTMQKQEREHPELNNEEYMLAQQTVLSVEPIQDSPQSLIYIYEEGGQVVVVKATQSGEDIFLTSLRRLSSSEAARSREIERLLKKVKK